MSSELKRMIQVGIVTDTDTKNRKVRVKFKDVNLTSDWLCILRQEPSVDVDNLTDGNSVALRITPWMPKVNDTVLVVYLPIFNSDGFVIGGI